jgi:hypothetical protein
MLNHRSIVGARSRRFAAVPSGCSLKLASLRGRLAGRSIPLAPFFAVSVLSLVAGEWSAARPDADARHAFDVVIYAGTAGGVIAAVAAARD